MITVKRKTIREFLGKLKDFDSKEERAFENAHLKAYKRGQEYFKFGKKPDGTPIFHIVKQKLENG